MKDKGTVTVDLTTALTTILIRKQEWENKGRNRRSLNCREFN